ncbi:hypothetical protein CLOSTASPAR_05355 [[Clostridium] asparagiforme DSM 15981]|uniref:Uncharacterized protein n=1 Tax=[Clostridium] asparagiforme DSM 15981 TaxID=518636 RepID=C0D7V8_9FIRM|nr:hypothetical protein CLOSTASPAR_05355 [[Clostridium] asparagiforme DSM 15981]
MKYVHQALSARLQNIRFNTFCQYISYLKFDFICFFNKLSNLILIFMCICIMLPVEAPQQRRIF